VPEKIIAKYRIIAATAPAGKNKPAILAHGGFGVSSRSSGDRFFELRGDDAPDLVACHHAPQHPVSALIQKAFFHRYDLPASHFHYVDEGAGYSREQALKCLKCFLSLRTFPRKALPSQGLFASVSEFNCGKK